MYLVVYYLITCAGLLTHIANPVPRVQHIYVTTKTPFPGVQHIDGTTTLLQDGLRATKCRPTSFL